MFIQYSSFNKVDEKSDTGSKLRTIGKFGNKKGMLVYAYYYLIYNFILNPPF